MEEDSEEIKVYRPHYCTPPQKFLRYEMEDWDDGHGNGGQIRVAYFLNKKGKECKADAQVYFQYGSFINSEYRMNVDGSPETPKTLLVTTPSGSEFNWPHEFLAQPDPDTGFEMVHCDWDEKDDAKYLGVGIELHPYQEEVMENIERMYEGADFGKHSSKTVLILGAGGHGAFRHAITKRLMDAGTNVVMAEDIDEDHELYSAVEEFHIQEYPTYVMEASVKEVKQQDYRDLEKGNHRSKKRRRKW